jgi:predicted RNase H-like HicB family nuclease
MQTSKDNLDLAHSATRSTLEKKFQEIDEIAKKYSETLINENLELEIMISNLQNNIDKEIKRLS